MKVLQIIDSLAMEGAQTLLAQLHGPLSARGVDCEYYLLHAENGILEQRLRAQGARIHAPLQASVYSPLHAWALRSHLRENHYDLVHVHLFPAQLWTALAASPSILLTTEHSSSNRRRRWWYRWVDHWMYGQYRSIASISAGATEALVKWLPNTRNKIVECLNGIDVDAVASAPAVDRQTTLGVAEGTFLILCVARLHPLKDHDTLLRAMCNVPQTTLLLVGDGPLREQLKRRASDLGIASRVRFLGRRPDVPNLLKAADLYVQPSLREGLALAPVEAMAAGLPVVASNVPGLAEVVGECGLMFPVGDDRALAQLIARLLADPQLRQRLSREARLRAQMFSIESTRDSYEMLYRNALQNGGAA